MPSPCVAHEQGFQSTRPSRGETGKASPVYHEALISIHSPLAGRDVEVVTPPALFDISIHSPLAGRDPIGGHPPR